MTDVSAPSVTGFALSTQQRLAWDGGSRAARTSRLRVARPPDWGPRTAAARLQALIDRHEVLRTRFEEVGALRYPVQVVEPAGCVSSPALAVSSDAHSVTLAAPPLCVDAVSLLELARALAGEDQAEARPTDEDVQYADYAGWQSALVEEADEQARMAAAHWRHHSVGGAAHRLPFSNRTTQGGHAVGRATRCLAGPARQRLEALASRWSCAVDVVLLALWMEQLAVLLDVDVSCGMVVPGRDSGVLSRAIGPYAMCVPLTLERPRGSFAAYARTVADAAEGCTRWAPYYQPDDAVARRSAHQFEYVPVTSPLPRVLDLDHRVEPFQLRLVVRPTGAALLLEVEHDEATVSREQAGRLADQLIGLVGRTLERPERPAGAALPLGVAERRQLAAWRGSPRTFDAIGTLPSRMASQACATPERIAIADAARQLSWHELDVRVNRLARYLRRRHGVGPEQRVVVCLERGIDALVAILAVLRAGGAYVPLDPRHTPALRLAMLVRECEAGLFIGDPALLEGHASPPAILCLTRDAAAIGAEEASPLDLAIDPRSLAYVIYTSGSTGTPKGVMVEHSSLMNLGEALRERLYGDGVARTVAVNAPLSFDSSIKQLVLLAFGFGLRVISENERADPRALQAAIETGAIDVLDVTPSLLEVLLDAGLADSRAVPVQLLVAGEALPEELWRRLSGSSRTSAHNLYGPTECTVDATVAPVTGDETTIGTPLANVSVQVLDAALELTPLGCVGELCIGGAGVARGYLNRPALTADCFRPDPYATNPGARLYRTGDRVRWREDGSVLFLGRRDHQIKRRGFRVELGEVEAVLEAHTDVRRAVVVSVEAGVAEAAELVGAVVSDASPSPETLQRYLAERLPDYMRPSRLVFVDDLPVSPNGKVDRHALAARLRDGSSTAARVPPRTDTESRLLEIWRAVLRHDAIGVLDDFFDIGGHSLAAMQLAARVLNTFKLELPLARIFQAPTIEGLAAVIDGLIAPTRPEAAVGVRRLRHERQRTPSAARAGKRTNP